MHSSLCRNCRKDITKEKNSKWVCLAYCQCHDMLSDSRVCLNFGGKILNPHPSLRKNSAWDISPSPSWKKSIGSVWNIISQWMTMTLIYIPHLQDVACWLARLYKIIETKPYSICWSAIPALLLIHTQIHKSCILSRTLWTVAARVVMDICVSDFFTCWRQLTTKNWRLLNNRGSCSWSWSPAQNRPSRLISFNNDFLRSDSGQRSA